MNKKLITCYIMVFLLISINFISIIGAVIPKNNIHNQKIKYSYFNNKSIKPGPVLCKLWFWTFDNSESANLFLIIFMILLAINTPLDFSLCESSICR